MVLREVEHARGPDRIEVVMPGAGIVAWRFATDKAIWVELAHYVPKEGSCEACALQRVGDMHLLDDEGRLLECAVRIVDL